MYEVVSSEERFHGAILRVFTEQVVMPDGSIAGRDVVHKLNAVGVVALDEENRVVLIRQYRNAVRQYLWELPAGLVDIDGEDLADTARRELAEETDLEAETMEHLIDLYLSPGFTSESIRLFVARGLRESAERHERKGEEADMLVRRVSLQEAVDMVFKGEITNAASVAGVLAAALKA